MAQEETPVIGLCGGIGAGKSAVARMFGELGGLVIQSDALNREVLRRADVRETLRGWWGSEILTPEGEVDRGRVAERVFEDPAARKRLEKLVHPLIAQRRTDMISESRKSGNVRAVILDSPLLFETSLDRLCDAIVFVAASESTRLQRVQQQRNWDIEQLRRREQWQLPLAEKQARADHVVRNESDLASLRDQVAEVFDEIVTAARNSDSP